MTTHSFIVWHDSLSGLPNTVECLSYETASQQNDTHEQEQQSSREKLGLPPLASGDFVVIQDSDQQMQWMGQVLEPQRNLPLQGLSRESPSAVAVFERILNGEINRSIFLNQVYYYRVQLVGEITSTGRLTSVRRRPRAGSVGHIADEKAVRQALDLPAILSDGLYGQNNILGRIHSTSIPIAVDWPTFKQHILVAGATGSGKSNTVANLVKAAQAYGACVIIYDQKPDYQDVIHPNDELRLFDRWTPPTIEPFGLEEAQRFALHQGGDERRADERLIAIRARDVSLDMLTSAFFPYSNEGNQRDLFNALLNHHASKVSLWTLKTFTQWIIQASRPPRKPGEKSELAQLAEDSGWGEIHDATLTAMQRKLAQRQMKWLDALEGSSTARGGIFGNSTGTGPTGYFEPARHLKKGAVLVIRTNASGREYALFLTYMLREVFNLKRNKQLKHPIVNIIDEAQDIFEGDAVGRDAADAMNEIIRKGRSQDVAFVIAGQSVSQIPDSVLTNMNSRIIHRQNSLDELRKAIPSAAREMMASALTFGAGEAMVSIIGTRSVVHGELAPSPFKLTKLSADPRQTLADQDEAQANEEDTL